MLYNIAITEDDNVFSECYENIKKSYYAEGEYIVPILRNMLPDWPLDKLPSEEGQLAEIAASLDKMTKQVCSSGKYVLMGGDNLPFPFIERFHSYFLQRKWNKPIRDPRRPTKAAELLRLHAPQKPTSESDNDPADQNYSKNSGDHNHFMNVVAAMARLINLFHDKKALLDFICGPDKAREGWEYFADTVIFQKGHGLRIFILMLAAYFHDIGKTIVNHRHGMEGSVIISEHTSQSWYQLSRIANRYNFGNDPKNPDRLDRNDLLFISDLLEFHDKFGTMSTGEAGCLQFVEIVERIKRYSLKHLSKSHQKTWAYIYLFDLWLLNVADIFVSITDKWEEQLDWQTLSGTLAKMNFIMEYHRLKVDLLTHDLHIAKELLTTVNQHRHTDVFPELISKAQCYSDRHVIERIRRIIFACIESSACKFCPDNHEDNPAFQRMLIYLSNPANLSESTLTSAIVRSINATGDFQEFCFKLSWIGQMDYALGFFESICTRALTRVGDELRDLAPPSAESDLSKEDGRNEKLAYCFRTKWIREKFSAPLDETLTPDIKAEAEGLTKLQSMLFVENFTITLVSLLDHLLLRDNQPTTKLKNIEFNETKQRLTTEKIDAIISLNGPYHAKRSIQLILKTVFIY